MKRWFVTFLSGISVLSSFCFGQVELGRWTYELSRPTDAGPHVAEAGVYQADASVLANVGGSFSNPLGNGSAESFNATTWSAGDYHEFALPTTDYGSLTFQLDMRRNSGAPQLFRVEVGTDPAGPFESAGTLPAVTSTGWITLGPIELLPSIEDAPLAYIRLVALEDGSGTDAIRVDNCVIAGQLGMTSGPTGACCFFNNETCIETSEEECSLMGGFYNGDGTLCAEADCLVAVNPDLVINEVWAGDAVTDDEEYAELYSATGTSLNGLSFIVISGDTFGDPQSTNNRRVTARVDLAGALGAGQRLIIGAGATSSAAADIQLDLGFLGNGSQTYAIVFTNDLDFCTENGKCGTEPIDDTRLTPESLLAIGTSTVDAVAVVDADAGDRVYLGAPVLPATPNGAAHWSLARQTDGLDTDTRTDWHYQDTTRLELGSPSGIDAVGDQLSTLDAANMPLPLGACCVAYQDCVETFRADCASVQGGTYLGDGALCSSTDCLGACCLEDGSCVMVVSEAACASLAGVFAGSGVTCDEVGCQPRVGACCQGGTCFIAGPVECVAQSGVFLGLGTRCDESGACEPNLQLKFDFDQNTEISPRVLSFVLAPDHTSTQGAFPSETDSYFGIVTRDTSQLFADDSATSDPNDVIGVLDSSRGDAVLGFADTINGQNAAPVQATWTIDIADLTDVAVRCDVAAMGDFEIGSQTIEPDSFTLTAQIDSQLPVTVFSTQVFEALDHTYTLENGSQIFYRDPIFINGSLIDNTFSTVMSDTLGSGTTLTLTLSGTCDGPNEVFAFDNLCVLGTSTSTSTCPCDINVSATVDFFDLLDFLDSWFAQATLADFNQSGTVDFFDLLDFLDCWFTLSGTAC